MYRVQYMQRCGYPWPPAFVCTPTGASICVPQGPQAARQPAGEPVADPVRRPHEPPVCRNLSPLARTRSPAHATAHAASCSAALSQSLASLIHRLEYPYEAWISVARVCVLCGCASVSERALLCLFLCVSRCFRGETVRTAYSTCSEVDTRGHAHSCAHSQAPLSVSHRWLGLFGNRLVSLSPTQFAGLTSLTYVAISLSSPAHARPHTQRHMQRPAQQRFPSR